ncbi:MAG TPA: CHAT domain-containing protein [Thermodesulfobacteriota bacterium]|nr:CHAT domain-containing protein [Thermodesulfobacteriota bacterium]
MTGSRQKALSEIANLEWEEFEKRLLTTTRGRRRAGADETAMRQYFGDEEFEELQKLAYEAQRSRQRAPVLGNLVLLPGIMGSYLVTVDNDDDEDLVWVNFFRLIKGDIKRLKLSPDGHSEANPKYRVKTSIIHKGTYARAMLKLSARWNVKPFAFDWRKDIDLSSRALADFIEEKFKDEPVHLVAHSMGGLVSRNFIRLHKDLWEKMRDGNGVRGGRLVMLGTPNYGSFAIPQTMTGVEKMVRLLEAADLKNNLKELLEIINTFVGSYEMLPAQSKIPEPTQAIYRAETWGKFPVFENHLKRALKFHSDLETEKTIDPERMTYIAGCNRETLSGLEIVEPGKFKYFITYDGDGRVPHRLGLLEGVKTYYVEEDHGSLPKNDKVITAIDQLLERGETSVLPDRPITARVTLPEGATWHRSLGEYLVRSEVEKIARQAEYDYDNVSPDDLRIAEETVMRAAIGENRPVKKPAHRKPAPPVRKKPLRIDVVLGDVTKVSAPVVVVGHYKGVTPISAIGALDKKLGGWIRQATEHSMLAGELGQLYFIPVMRNQIAADTVLVAGMGQEGKFSRDDLSYLMLNVTQAISTLELDSFASVIIGGGQGSLELDDALKAILLGISEALERMGDKKKVRRITFVEFDSKRHKDIADILTSYKDENFPPNLEIKVFRRALPGAIKKPKAKTIDRSQDRRADEFGPRITIERDGDVFRFSALTRTAVIPVREVEIQSFFSEGMSDRLMSSSTKGEQEMFGQLLHSLIPEEFHAFYDTVEPLTLILDRSTASLPWEMACFDGPRGTNFFGTELRLTRQFRTLLSPAPAIAPKLNDRLRVLVIADPAPDRLHLPGAQEEGREVVRILNQVRNEWGLKIEVIDRIGPAECEPVEILALLHNEEFDVVHFAGHGIFDQEKPSRSGWVFGLDKGQPEKLRTLSALEIFRLRRAPRLVFSNACFSAVVYRGKPLTAEEMNRNLAGLAEAFFERGVLNYIGAGWPVQDDLAIGFATEFYTQALIGRPAKSLGSNSNLFSGEKPGSAKGRPNPLTLGQAVSEARRLILHNGSTWGAYQHYGQASDKLIKLEDTPESKTAPMPKTAARKEGKARPSPKRER